MDVVGDRFMLILVVDQKENYLNNLRICFSSTKP